MANQGKSFSVINTKDCERKGSDACGFFVTGENVMAASVVIKTQNVKDIKDCFERVCLKVSIFVLKLIAT